MRTLPVCLIVLYLCSLATCGPAPAGAPTSPAAQPTPSPVATQPAPLPSPSASPSATPPPTLTPPPSATPPPTLTPTEGATRTATLTRTPLPRISPTPSYILKGSQAGTGLAFQKSLKIDAFRIMHSQGRIIVLETSMKLREIDLPDPRYGNNMTSFVKAQEIYDVCIAEGTIWGYINPPVYIDPSTTKLPEDKVLLQNYRLQNGAALGVKINFGEKVLPLGYIACSGENFWMSNAYTGLIQRVDSSGPDKPPLLVTLATGPAPLKALHYFEDHLWAAGPLIQVIHKTSGSVVATYPFAPDSLAVDARAFWMAFYDTGIIQGVARKNGQPLAPLALGCHPADLASTGQYLLVACDDIQEVLAFEISQ